MLPLSQGILAAFLTVLAVAAVARVPTRRRCPACGAATVALRPASRMTRWGGGLLALRWCSGCGWRGVGRQGPEWVPGRRVAHDSGFHWGQERLPEDFGFRFAEPEPPPPGTAPAPSHPSGFRFAAPEPGPPAAHRSGFSWGGPGASARRRGARPAAGPISPSAAPVRTSRP